MIKKTTIESTASIIKDLHTVRDYLRWAMSKFLENNIYYGHGTDNSWDESIHLVLQALNLPLDIDERILDSNLTSQEKKKIVNWVKRRVGERIPLPYLTNIAWFAEMKFYVDERVIIPRSPISEFIRNNFAPWVDESKINNILDLCTGSGCIGIASACTFENANVTLSDISSDAIAVAKYNVAEYNLSDRVKVIQSDLFGGLKNKKFDLIISNPPYVDMEDINSMPEEFHKEPSLALKAGDNGLDIVHRILIQATDYMTKHGILIVEVGNSQYALRDIYTSVPFTWLSFQDGGDGVFLITYDELVKYRKEFIDGSLNGR